MASYVTTVATLAYIHRLFTEVKLRPATEETEEQSEAVAETEDTSSWADWETVEQQSRRESGRPSKLVSDSRWPTRSCG